MNIMNWITSYKNMYYRNIDWKNIECGVCEKTFSSLLLLPLEFFKNRNIILYILFVITNWITRFKRKKINIICNLSTIKAACLQNVVYYILITHVIPTQYHCRCIVNIRCRKLSNIAVAYGIRSQKRIVHTH